MGRSPCSFPGREDHLRCRSSAAWPISPGPPLLDFCRGERIGQNEPESFWGSVPGGQSVVYLVSKVFEIPKNFFKKVFGGVQGQGLCGLPAVRHAGMQGAVGPLRANYNLPSPTGRELSEESGGGVGEKGICGKNVGKTCDPPSAFAKFFAFFLDIHMKKCYNRTNKYMKELSCHILSY